jgi:hypothetical protein
LYGILSSWKPSQADIDGFFEKASDILYLIELLGTGTI